MSDVEASPFRGIDHIAIAVRDTEAAVEYYCRSLRLKVAHTDVFDEPPVVLTYLDAGNAYIQLIAPRVKNSDLSRWLDEHGEGLHHICFGVDDVAAAVDVLSSPDFPRLPLGRGRGRISGFVANGAPQGVTIELTEWPRSDGPSRAGAPS